MENKLIFKDKELVRWDNTVLGISGENEQETLVFSFEDGFVDGTCDLDIEFPNGEKGCIEKLEKDEENECYKLVVKSGLLRYEGIVKMQLKIIQKTEVWKCKDFEMHVLEAINAVETIEEQYPTWAKRMTIRVSELEEGMKQIGEKVDNFEETDPTVPSHVKKITKKDIENWNNKSDFSGNYEDLENKPKNLVQDENYVHTDNNFTNEEKKKLETLKSYDDTEIRRELRK